MNLLFNRKYFSKSFKDRKVQFSLFDSKNFLYSHQKVRFKFQITKKENRQNKNSIFIMICKDIRLKDLNKILEPSAKFTKLNKIKLAI
jgi:hypothetical protein